MLHPRLHLLQIGIVRWPHAQVLCLDRLHHTLVDVFFIHGNPVWIVGLHRAWQIIFSYWHQGLHGLLSNSCFILVIKYKLRRFTVYQNAVFISVGLNTNFDHWYILFSKERIYNGNVINQLTFEQFGLYVLAFGILLMATNSKGIRVPHARVCELSILDRHVLLLLAVIVSPALVIHLQILQHILLQEFDALFVCLSFDNCVNLLFHANEDVQ